MDEAELKVQRSSPELINEFNEVLPELLRAPKITLVKRMLKLLEPFQEWPQLIDPHLSSIVQTLVRKYLTLVHEIPENEDYGLASDDIPLSRAICMVIALLCKIRGHKVITRWFTNDARYLVPLLTAFDASIKAENDHRSSKEAQDDSLLNLDERYILLLWISHLLLAPFDLESFSYGTPKTPLTAQLNEPQLPDGLPWVASHAVRLAVHHVAQPAKDHEAAILLLVRIALRPDMQQFRLFQVLLDWVLSFLKDPSFKGLFCKLSSTNVCIHLLSLLAKLVSSADNVVIVPLLGDVFETVCMVVSEHNSIDQLTTSSAITRKLVIKVLRAVVAQLQFSPSLPLPQVSAPPYSKVAIFEGFYDHLFKGLVDKETQVRMTASKALSIMTTKLQPVEVDGIVGDVINRLEEDVLWEDAHTGLIISNLDTDYRENCLPRRNLTAVNPYNWHGMVLALSQLLFRRSLPSQQLPKVLNALIIALSFEQRSTAGTSIGTNVRDAACFGLWAIARQYKTNQILAVETSTIGMGKIHKDPMSMLQTLANELIVTTTLDPAGNIRRAASASLQELIGRHPDTIDQGISVVQALDYHAIALRSKALTKASFAASFLSNFYWPVILDGLLGWRGIDSQDAQSRRDTATALANLSTNHLQLVLERARQTLRSTKNTQIEERHALILSLAAIVVRMGERVDEEEVQPFLRSLNGLEKVFDDVSFTQPQFAPSARKSHLVAEAVTSLTAAVGQVGPGTWPIQVFLSDILKEDLSKRVDEIKWSLQHRDEIVIERACAALDGVFSVMNVDDRQSLVSGWLSSSSDSIIGRSYGVIMALGVAYRWIRKRNRAFEFGIRAKLLSRTESTEVETKVWALRSLASSVLLEEDLHHTTAHALGRCLEDHTTDHRGDVGSLVRLEAIKAVHAAMKRKDPGDGYPVYPHGIERLLPKICGLAVEKLDRVRLQAYRCIRDIHFYQSAFPKSEYKEHDTVTGTEKYFHQFLSLIEVPVLRRDILEEFVVSASLANDALLATSRAALAMHCIKILPCQLDELCTTLLNILSDASKDRYIQKPDRHLIPVMDVWAFLLEIGVLDRLEDGETLQKYRPLVDIVKVSCSRSTSVRKLEAAINIYSGILSTPKFSHSHEKAAWELTGMLAHRYPKIRTAVVDALFLHYRDISLLQYMNFNERKASEVEIRMIRGIMALSGNQKEILGGMAQEIRPLESW